MRVLSSGRLFLIFIKRVSCLTPHPGFGLSQNARRDTSSRQTVFLARHVMSACPHVRMWGSDYLRLRLEKNVKMYNRYY